ncbi:MAG: Ig-like domain-containing protein [Anaerolineales bacterium]|nr:Ig-like domain-containing protein [Anaerolineales bacterium]
MFIHHPDNLIIIDDLILPLGFWTIVAPTYALPEPYSGREFIPNVRHHLLTLDGVGQDQADLGWAEGIEYIAQKATYQAAWDAYQQGAFVFLDNNQVVIQGPPVLSADKTHLDNDGQDTITLTCVVSDLDFNGSVTWTVVAPDESEVSVNDTAVDGSATWQLTTSFEGFHTIRVVVEQFGTAHLSFEGV